METGQYQVDERTTNTRTRKWPLPLEVAPTGQGFLTCSNDGAVKSWTLDGLEMQNLQGHSGFVFDVPDATSYEGARSKA